MSLPSCVVALLAQHFGVGNVNSACEKAKQLATLIKELLEDAEDGLIEVSQEQLVSPDDDAADPTWCPTFDDEEDEDEVDDPFSSPGGKKAKIDDEEFKKAIEFYRSPNKGYRSFTSMTTKFRWIKGEAEMRSLRRYEKKEQDKENRRKNFEMIKRDLLRWVQEKMNDGHSLHDDDLQRQAIRINREQYKVLNFKASHSFIQSFKQENKLCSRKITKFIAKKSWANRDKVDQAATEYVETVKKLVKKHRIPPTAVFNADQTGLVKELHGARSLAYVGEKNVLRVVESVSATMHSCTVLPMVSAGGILHPKTFVVLQEPGGKFPRTPHFQPDNLVIRAHTSHIMTKALTVEWLKECIAQNIPKTTLLVLDSWAPFGDHEEIQKHMPAGKKVIIANIPGGATGKIQPLDVFFFAIFKRFIRKITSHSTIHALDFKIHQRDNLLKSISQVLWLFAHPRFRHFLQYSWSAAGYTNKPPNFETPIQYCLDSLSTLQCEIGVCDSISFLRCAYCEKEICFQHFLNDVHRCK